MAAQHLFDMTCDTITGPFAQVWDLLESTRGVTVTSLSKRPNKWSTQQSILTLTCQGFTFSSTTSPLNLTDEASVRVRDGQKICSIVGKLSATDWTLLESLSSNWAVSPLTAKRIVSMSAPLPPQLPPPPLLMVLVRLVLFSKFLSVLTLTLSYSFMMTLMTMNETN